MVTLPLSFLVKAMINANLGSGYSVSWSSTGSHSRKGMCDGEQGCNCLSKSWALKGLWLKIDQRCVPRWCVMNKTCVCIHSYMYVFEHVPPLHT